MDFNNNYQENSSSSSSSPERSSERPYSMALVSLQESLNEIQEMRNRDTSSSSPQEYQSGPTLQRGTAVSKRGFRGDPGYHPFVYIDPKLGFSGKVIPLLSNYFTLKKVKENWNLYEHNLEFSLDLDVSDKKELIESMTQEIGPFITSSDGYSRIYSIKRLDSLLIYRLASSTDNPVNNPEELTVTIKFMKKLMPTDIEYTQCINQLIHRCLPQMKLQQLGDHFYNMSWLTRFKGRNQSVYGICPGVITSMGYHDNNNMMLCVDIHHKIIHEETASDFISKLRSPAYSYHQYQKIVSKILVGSTVLSTLSNKTYKIVDIGWDLTPRSTFQKKDGTSVTCLEHVRSKYGDYGISDFHQPLLKAQATIQRNPGVNGSDQQIPTTYLLIPGYCQMTGMTDEMREDVRLMTAIQEHCDLTPARRIEGYDQFIQRMLSMATITQELAKWGLEFSKELVECKGRVLHHEKIVFGFESAEGAKDGINFVTNDNGKWYIPKMLKCASLENWIILVPSTYEKHVNNLVNIMVNLAKPLGFKISPPVEIIEIKIESTADSTTTNYLGALDCAKNSHQNLQLAFVILLNNKPEPELYGAVKKRLSSDLGIPSQCLLAKNLTSKDLVVIANNLVVQMNAKLGGEPWNCTKIPLHDMMVVGFDVYRTTEIDESTGCNIYYGAMVATTNSTYSSYFSIYSRHSGPDELKANLMLDMKKCLDAYKLENEILPNIIVFYRAALPNENLTEGEFGDHSEAEVPQFKAFLKQYYINDDEDYEDMPPVKLIYISVSKQNMTRFFASENSSPPIGTIVDNDITRKQWWEFYMFSNAGATDNPTLYNILCDDQNLKADKIQLLTYRLCHLDYNRTGTAAAPAPCQYAQKLAFLAGTAFGEAEVHQNLSSTLHFL